jgi:hypothetical protein
MVEHKQAGVDAWWNEAKAGNVGNDVEKPLMRCLAKTIETGRDGTARAEEGTVEQEATLEEGEATAVVMVVEGEHMEGGIVGHGGVRRG